MSPLAMTMFCGTFAALGNVAGGAIVTSRFRPGQRSLTPMVAFGGGFMLAAALMKMVPESMRLAGSRQSLAPALFVAGYMFIHFIEHVLGDHFHLGAEPHDPDHAHQQMSVATLTGLCIHALFDGVTIASGFAVAPSLGMLLFLAVLLHKIPEGSTVASVMLFAGYGNRGAMLASSTLAIATLLGSLLMAVTSQSALSIAMPLATGMTIHVAASDLIPEVNELRGAKMAAVVMAGALAFFLSDSVVETLSS